MQTTLLITPLMNVNDLATTAIVMGNINKTQILNKSTYVLRYGHVKTFLNAHFSYLALTNIDLSTL